MWRMLMNPFNDQAQNYAVTENRRAGNCICVIYTVATERLLAREAEKGRSIWIAT